MQGVYSLQLVKGLLLTVDSGGVYSKKSTVKSTVGQGGSKGVYSSLGNSLYCRL